jgi:type III secretion system low calcium response chaperone LcrH/SycD
MEQQEQQEKVKKIEEILAKSEAEHEDLTVLGGDKIAKLTAAAGGPAKDTVAALLSAAGNKGIMPRHALQLGDDTMEAIYGQGYNLYNQGRYKEASYIFRLLMLLDYMTPKYILGLAACLHRLKDYKTATNVYLLCGTIDATNPLPHYHAADCYIQLGIPLLATFSLGLAIKAAGDQPQYSIVKERATLMREALYKQLKEEADKKLAEKGISAEDEPEKPSED